MACRYTGFTFAQTDPKAMPTADQIQQALLSVTDPLTGQALAGPKALKNLVIEGGNVSFEIELGYPAKSRYPELRQQLIAAARTAPGVENVSVQLSHQVVAHAA